MRTIKYTTQFKRDYKRIKKTPRHKTTIDRELLALVNRLAHDKPLTKKYCDHSLVGEWKDHRDCHLKPDLILIYRKPTQKTLELVRLGSHSQLGL